MRKSGIGGKEGGLGKEKERRQKRKQIRVKNHCESSQLLNIRFVLLGCNIQIRALSSVSKISLEISIFSFVTDARMMRNKSPHIKKVTGSIPGPGIFPCDFLCSPCVYVFSFSSHSPTTVTCPVCNRCKPPQQLHHSCALQCRNHGSNPLTAFLC